VPDTIGAMRACRRAALRRTIFSPRDLIALPDPAAAFAKATDAMERID
jgi:hypothetical protein